MTATIVAALLSGVPSTAFALARRGDPLEAPRAAGTLVVGERASDLSKIVAAAPVHLAISSVWAMLLTRSLPARNRAVWGAVAGLWIAVLDLGFIGRRLPAIRRLPVLPQLADHALFGAIVGALTKRSPTDQRAVELR